jgi:protein pelota
MPNLVFFQFYEYMIQMAIKTDNKVILENKSKFVLCHASSGGFFFS